MSGAAAPARPDLPAELQSPTRLFLRRFQRHRVAAAALWLLAALYLVAAAADFFAPYPAGWGSLAHAYCPPQPLRLSLRHGLYVHPVRGHVDPVTLRRTYQEDRERVTPLSFFPRGPRYRLWGLVPLSHRFFGVDRAVRERARAADPAAPGATAFLLGADKYGRDILSRAIHGARISLSVSVAGILFTLLLGVSIGGVSGYFGGWSDTFIQRVIEIVNALPRLPLWLALAAALPDDWSPLATYLAIVVVLGMLGWTSLARVVRGRVLALREEDYALAARFTGAGHARVLFRHLIPGITSHLIVSVTLAIPVMILGETSLSFLGLGLRPPIVSWGVMLQDCRDVKAVTHYPWLLVPVAFIILTVMCFNFVGDGLRDAADPRASR